MIWSAPRESRPGGVGGQSQKLEHPRELTRWIGEELLVEQEQTLLPRHLRQQSAYLRRIAIKSAVLLQVRIRPSWRQVLPLEARLLQSPRLLKIGDVLLPVLPLEGVH